LYDTPPEALCQIQEAELAYIEHDFPIEGLDAIAQKEGNAKKPIYQMHKWWARRLGSVFRMLILAAFAEENVQPTELWRRLYTHNQLTAERKGLQPTTMQKGGWLASRFWTR
jgi:adenine-specific DNA methylase